MIVATATRRYHARYHFKMIVQFENTRTYRPHCPEMISCVRQRWVFVIQSTRKDDYCKCHNIKVVMIVSGNICFRNIQCFRCRGLCFECFRIWSRFLFLQQRDIIRARFVLRCGGRRRCRYIPLSRSHGMACNLCCGMKELFTTTNGSVWCQLVVRF